MKKVNNSRVHFEYTILQTFEAGMGLLGSEVKTVKSNRISLEGAYVRIIGTEVFLVNAEIPLYPYARPDGYDPRRTRKLLMHKREILLIKGKMTQGGLTLVPLSCYTKRGYVKLEIGLARGKKEYEKREKIKRKDISRDVERELREKD